MFQFPETFEETVISHVTSDILLLLHIVFGVFTGHRKGVLKHASLCLGG